MLLRNIKFISNLNISQQTHLLLQYVPIKNFVSDWPKFFAFSDTQKNLRDTIEKFCRNEIVPIAKKVDKESHFPKEIFRKLGELGFNGISVSSKFGGSEMGYLEHCIVMEEISRFSASIGLSYGAHSNLCINTLDKNGDEKQKSKYLPKLCSGEFIGALAMSETEAGSDVISMRLKAEKKGHKYILNGTKMWITNSPVADVVIVYAKTDPNLRSKGISVFIIERGFKGFQVRQKFDKLGMRGSPTAELSLENCEVPEENMLGGRNKGVYMLMNGLNLERLVMSAGPIGIMQACNDIAFPYASTRKQFGQSIGSFQLMQGKIADMNVRLQTSRAYTYSAARAADKGFISRKDCTGALLHASENATQSALQAIQCLGGNGYMNDYDTGRLLRDAKFYEIGAGTTEIRRIVIAREILKEYSRLKKP